MKDQRGVVYLETLIAFVPVFLFFLGTLQIADAGAAHLIVKHAATVAARAAVVVLPDDGVFYNDKDNALLHQFDGLRRDDIESAADYVLGSNARLDGTGDNVSIAFSAPPVPTPTGETDAEKSRSFGERLLDTSNRGDGEQNMRELVTVRVNAQYRCLVAALCSRGFDMVSEASLVYQGARYVYEAWTNGVRNAASRPHSTSGDIVNTANPSPSPDPNAAADPSAGGPDDGADPNADGDGDGDGDQAAPPSADPNEPTGDPIAHSGSEQPGTPGTPGPGANGQNPSNGSNSNGSASNPGTPGSSTGSNNSNGSNASASNSGTSNGSNANASNSGNSNASNASNDSNASASNSGTSTGANGSNASHASGSNPSNNPSASANKPSNSSGGRPSNGSNSSTGSNANASGSNANGTNSSNSGVASNSSATNSGSNQSPSRPSPSKPEIIARPPQDDSNPSPPGNDGRSTASADGDDSGNGKTTGGSSHSNSQTANTRSQDGAGSQPSSSSQETNRSNDRDTSRPGRGTASARGPPSARDIVAGSSRTPATGERTSASSSARTPSADASGDGNNGNNSDDSDISDDDNREVAASPSYDDGADGSETGSGSEASSGPQNSTRPGRGSASPRAPPSAASIVAGAASGDSDSRAVTARGAQDGTSGTNPSEVLASAANATPRDPAILGVDSRGRTHLRLDAPACFVAGTQIETASGWKPIETIEAGDRVLAFDVAAGTVVERSVLHSFKRQTRALVDLEVQSATGSAVITGTPEHPFYLPELGKYVPMGLLAPGAVLTTTTGDAARVQSTRLREGQFEVFNFEVAEHHNYFVAAPGTEMAGVLVHNAACPRPQRGDVDSPRRLVTDSPLTRRELDGTSGHDVYQVGNEWTEPAPEYRGRHPDGVPPDGHRRYRMVEIVDDDGRVVSQREEIFIENPTTGKPRWVQRGREGKYAGDRMERASDLLSQELIESGEIAAAFNTQNASGQGFDGVTLSYDKEGNPRVTLIEVKDYPGRYVPYSDFTAVGDNLEANLSTLNAAMSDPDEVEALGLTDEQAAAVRDAIAEGNINIEVRLGPDTKLGASRGEASGQRNPDRVVDQLEEGLRDGRGENKGEGLGMAPNGRVSIRQIPREVVDRVNATDPAIGSQPRFYALARGPNGTITHAGQHRANRQLTRERPQQN